MSYVVSGSKPVKVTSEPASAGGKVVIGSPPSCGVKMTAYCVMARWGSPVNSGGGPSQFRVMELLETLTVAEGKSEDGNIHYIVLTFF